ncbi:MAG: hypothetical protein V4632_02880 [Pseudomonadota bacterium]
MKKISLVCLLALGVGLHAKAQNTNGIQKCVSHGKTIYSDTECPRGTTSKNLEISHARGITSPDRQTINETRARIQDEMWVDAVPGRSITRTVTKKGIANTSTIENPLPIQAKNISNKKADCAAITGRISSLESMARQPQSGEMQDWIKLEKAKEQSRSYDIKC